MQKQFLYCSERHDGKPATPISLQLAFRNLELAFLAGKNSRSLFSIMMYLQLRQTMYPKEYIVEVFCMWAFPGLLGSGQASSARQRLVELDPVRKVCRKHFAHLAPGVGCGLQRLQTQGGL